MPAIKGKDGPLPSKTVEFSDFSKGLQRDGSRDGIDDKALWESTNVQVIGPGDLRTLTGRGAAVYTVPPESTDTIVSLWGVMLQLDKVESARMIVILQSGTVLAIDPVPATDPLRADIVVAGPGSVDPAARVTMWRDTHVLFAGVTTGFSSWDGRTFLTYPATFQGTSVDGSTVMTWVAGPTPASALISGMAISGPGLPAGTTVLALTGGDVAAPATFLADAVAGSPALIWTAGPTLATTLKPGLGITGPGIAAGTTITAVGADWMAAGTTFTANTVAGSPYLAWTGGFAAAQINPSHRVIGAGIPAINTIVGDNANWLTPGSTLLVNLTAGSATATLVDGGSIPVREAPFYAPGVVLTGAGIPAGTVTTSVVGDTLTLSQQATATASGVLLTVYPTFVLSVNATATATGVTLTIGPVIYLTAPPTTTSPTGTFTVVQAITLSATATTTSVAIPPGTGLFTIGAGAPKGTNVDPNGAGPRDIAAFEGRIWLILGNRGWIFSGPGSFTTFESVYAGGADSMPDSVFPGNITTLHAAVQLLWFFGPGAINTLSNVQIVSGRTVYQNENLVAGTGTALAASVQPLFRSMMFLSPPGVYAILGATPQKLSDALDGLMPDVAPVGPAPAAVFTLNELLCYGVLVDLAGQRRILIYSRPTWFVADQGPDLLCLTSVLRTDGQIQPWGATATQILPLFASDVGDWDVRLKMFDFGMFTRRDTARRVAAQAQLLLPTPPALPTATANLQIEIENETQAVPVGHPVTSEVTWINTAGVLTPWVNASAGAVTWDMSGDLVYYTETKVSGNLLSVHLFGRASAPLILGGVAMEIGIGGEWTFAP
jgi:hypothetical protein